MPRYCKFCKLFEGGLSTEKQSDCRHYWVETKVRMNSTIDESIFLWLRDKALRTDHSQSYWIELALIDMKIKDSLSPLLNSEKI